MQAYTYFPTAPCRVLEPNMVITVEPGCYFNPALLKPALEDKTQAAFLVKDRVQSLLVSLEASHELTAMV